ncbi:small G protein family protein / RhoGAP family protein isoform X2 [Tasmannia lanceolata]|uniref:small G protein family protein / RhoGAP family protein isoform X2 n=1 Tax=Tasmannia lanceolata TaxID=3420 RepID=UPI004064BEBE
MFYCFCFNFIIFGEIVAMSSTVSPQWREKATGFLSSSGVKLKQAGQSVGEVAKDASVNVADAAERVGSLVKTRWALIQQARQRPASRDAVQERIMSAAASTSTLLKKGITETKDKVVVGKMKVEEAAKKTANKSKSILNNIERWQKGVASSDVFAVPIEITVQRQQSSRPIPQILVRCADFLILSGLHSEYLFKYEGDKKAIQQLISLYNQEWNASLPEGVNPVDVAALVKCYIASLPEPLATFELYHEIRDAHCSIRDIKNVLKKLPNVNYMTLEFVTALLRRVSQKSSLNKMDARSLAMELAPAIIWQKGFRRLEHWQTSFNYSSQGPSKTMSPTFHDAWDTLSEDDGVDASSPIPLDDGLPTDFAAIEVIQCLIEHHNAIFTDANETVWR